MATDDSQPRGSAPQRRADGERSRAAILHEAARMATIDGLDGLSLARLAEAVGMSKSGLFAHFGSKEELQLATIQAATVTFEENVIRPAEVVSAGVPRLRAYTERFLRHIEEGIFPGGCFFVSALSELDSHPGPARDSAMAFGQHWMTLLAEQVAAGQAAGDVDPAEEPAQVAFEIEAYMVLGNILFVATGDGAPLAAVRRAIDARISALAVKA